MLAVGLVSGCASTAKKSGDDAEYEYIKVTGSNLRVKVKKGEKYDGGSVGVGAMSAPDVHETSGQVEPPAGAAGR